MMPALATDEQPINPCTHIYSDTLQVDGVSVSYQPEQKFAYLPASTGLDEGYYIVTANVAKPTATGMTYESFHVLQRDGQRFKFLKTIEWADAPIEIKNLFGVGSISINAINQDE